jgi:hypothetical protein
MKIEKNKVVYTHVNPNNGHVFYVGSGGIRRAKATHPSVRSKAWIEYVQEHNNIKPVVSIYKSGLSPKEASQLEELLIDMYGIENLVNEQVGAKRSEKWKIEKSESMKLNNNT